VGSLVVFPLALLPEGERCIYPQCNKRRYKEDDGKVHDFCGRYHATEYKKLKGGIYEGCGGSIPGCHVTKYLKASKEPAENHVIILSLARVHPAGNEV
jgi:hypothetical protein